MLERYGQSSMTSWELLTDGMICIDCRENGPKLVVSGDEIPYNAAVVFEFDCGECGQHWRWQVLGPDMYGLLSEEDFEELVSAEEDG